MRRRGKHGRPRPYRPGRTILVVTEPPRFLPPEGARPTHGAGAPSSLLGAPKPADDLEPATIAKRTVALLVDYVVLPLVVAIAIAVVVTLAVGDEPAFTDTYVEDGEVVVDEYVWPVIAGLGGAVLWSLLVPWLMLGLWQGRTIGRRLVRIRLVMDTGEPPTVGRAFLREIIVKGGLAFFTFPIVASYLWALWDRRRRTLHDIICSTRAVADDGGQASDAGPPRAFGGPAEPAPPERREESASTLPPPPPVDADLGGRRDDDDDDLAKRIGLGG